MSFKRSKELSNYGSLIPRGRHILEHGEPGTPVQPLPGLGLPCTATLSSSGTNGGFQCLLKLILMVDKMHS